MKVYLLGLSGEIILKSGRTRPRFQRRLVDNIEDALSREGFTDFKVRIQEARLIVKAGNGAGRVLERVFGIHSVAEAFEIPFSTLDDLALRIEDLLKDSVKNRKFAVRARRSGKHSFTSMDVARVVGARLYPYSSGVDLGSPEVEVFIEVRGSKAYVYTDKTQGPGGLPIGVEGRVAALFSGGFDSPVAAWYAARRGCEVDFIHFILGSPRSAYYAFKVARELARQWLYGYRPKFLVVDLGRIVAEMMKVIRRDYLQVVLRAVMYIVADKLASARGYDALVTGESLGQASSQTLKNIGAVESVVQLKLPVLRPLIGFDKEEIISFNRKLKLYRLSSRVEEFCAIASGPVATKASPRKLAYELSKIPGELLDDAAKRVKEYDLLSSSPNEPLMEQAIEIDFIPENALVIDVRDEEEFKRWHYPGAIHISQLKNIDDLKNRTVVFYCDKGDVSYLFAKQFREEGITAFSVKNGIFSIESCRR